MGGEHRAAPSLPMGVDEGDVVCMSRRGGPSPPRVLRECWGVGVKELLMGSGCGHVYPASPPCTPLALWKLLGFGTPQ